MDAELENLQRLNTSLELQLAELQGKLKATSKELVSERERNQEARALFRHIRFDLHNASGLIQEPKKLKDTVKVHAPPCGSCRLLCNVVMAL
jgi:predicted  nucleic acid-binding Zn-ribbon protein